MAHKTHTVERKIGRIAERSYGVVTRGELLAAGITVDQIRQRLKTGALLREHAGVYRVGHGAPSVEARYLAAVRACGDGAVLSGPAAAHLYRLTRGPAPPAEVTSTRQHRIKEFRIRRATRIDPREVSTWRGIPVTTVPRTLVDIAPSLAEDQLAIAFHNAGASRFHVKPAAVEAVLARRPNAPGAAKLRRVIRGDVKVLLSELERGFLGLLGKARLPLPGTNRPAGGRYVDCRWPVHRLTVELDSYSYHNSRHSWELDRRREREAYARDDEFRRYTWGDVFEDPRLMLRELRGLLGSAGLPVAA